MAYPDVYHANDNRYETMPYNRSGGTGLKLPAITLGLWHNFGDDRPLGTHREILRTAFDHGVTVTGAVQSCKHPVAGTAEVGPSAHAAADPLPLRPEDGSDDRNPLSPAPHL